MGLAFAAPLAAISAYSNYEAQQDQAKATKEYNDQVLANTIDSYHALAATETDTLDASYDSSLDAQVKYLNAKAQAQNNAAAAGVAGGSVNQILGELKRQRDADISLIINNREAAFDEINSQAKALQKGGQAQLRTIKKPNAGAALLKGLQDGVAVYSVASEAGASFREYGGFDQLSKDFLKWFK